MKRYMDLTGQRYGRLTAIKFAETRNRGAFWLCQCDCGKHKTVSAKTLRSGHAKSCGCLNKEKSTKRVVDINTTHGKSGTRLYGIWKGIKKRCCNENANTYSRYGGRGIAVCGEWQSFEPFYEWAINNGYTDDLCIDRIDNDGDYEPINCRWTTMTEQARNRSSSRYFDYNNKKLTLAEWSEESGISKKKLEGRIYDCGWDIARALSTL